MAFKFTVDLTPNHMVCHLVKIGIEKYTILLLEWVSITETGMNLLKIYLYILKVHPKSNFADFTVVFFLPSARIV